MPIIRLTVADKLQTTVIPAGYYPAEITEIDGPKASASKKSNHYFTTFTIIDGPFKGKALTVSFNTETNNANLLGSMQFFPVAALADVQAAINKTKVDVTADEDLDTDNLPHKPLDIQVGVQPDAETGKLYNIIVSFQEAGYGQKAPAF